MGPYQFLAWLWKWYKRWRSHAPAYAKWAIALVGTIVPPLVIYSGIKSPMYKMAFPEVAQLYLWSTIITTTITFATALLMRSFADAEKDVADRCLPYSEHIARSIWSGRAIVLILVPLLFYMQISQALYSVQLAREASEHGIYYVYNIASLYDPEFGCNFHFYILQYCVCIWGSFVLIFMLGRSESIRGAIRKGFYDRFSKEFEGVQYLIVQYRDGDVMIAVWIQESKTTSSRVSARVERFDLNAMRLKRWIYKAEANKSQEYYIEQARQKMKRVSHLQ